MSERGNDAGSAAVAGRLRFPLVCFDLDGTLVDDTVYIWSTLHEHFRTDAARRARAREDFYAGRISYTSWFQNDLELLDEAGARRATMVALILSVIFTFCGSQLPDRVEAILWMMIGVSAALFAPWMFGRAMPDIDRLYHYSIGWGIVAEVVGGMLTALIGGVMLLKRKA